MASQRPITLLQFTDTHFFGTPSGRLMGVDTASTFREVRDLARKQEGEPDFYLLTGDLSQDETPESYARFARELAAIQSPAYFLPGNHDARDSMNDAFTASEAPIRPEESFTSGKWLVVLLDTQVPGKIGGRLAPDQLNRLDALLSEHKDKHALVTMHHHPIPIGAVWLDQICVENGDEFFALIGKHDNVRGVLWGHVHQEFDDERNGIRLLATPSTCVQFKPKSAKFALDAVPPGYRLLKLFDDGKIETRVQRTANVAAGLERDSAGY
jgi:Icc protein